MEKEEVLQFIPQKPPIQLVHDISLCEEGKAVTHFEVEAGHLFVQNDKLTPSGLIENMAQSVALHSGYFAYKNATKGEQKEPQVGYIAGVDKITVHALPQVGTVLSTEIQFLNEVFGVQIVKAIVKKDETTYCEGELKIINAQEAEEGALRSL